MERHDFDALRADRNAKLDAFVEKMNAEGWNFVPCAMREKNACYCACNTGGPCEHDWNGKPYESVDGTMWSATCSRCGMTAMSHSLRTAE